MNQDNNLAQTFLGTRGYLAPEMIQRRQYSRAVDAWALGVIVFVLLCGCLPFDDDSTILSDDAIQAKFTLRFPRWARNLSPSAKDLLSKLLDVNASTRYTAEEALGHPWICGTTAPKDAMLQSPGKIMLTPGKKKNPTKVAAANRTQMNEMIKNRARANSLTRNHARANSTARSRANSNARARDNSNPRPQILVREKSI
jgi:serine/threonine protein kinase